MNKITDVQLDVLIKSAVNSSGPLPPDEKFAQIISALSELRELRAAMLQGAEPVQGWIPCSERMPEKMVSVLATGDWFDYAVTAWDGGEWLDFDDYEPPVTHWMPLPKQPQQNSDS